MVNDLDYEVIKLYISKKISARLNKKLIFALICIVMKMI